MLISIPNNNLCAWFNLTAHDQHKDQWPGIPPRLRVGSPIIGAMASTVNFSKDDTFVYVGKKILTSKDGEKTRQIRLVLARGQVGFVEGYDVKYFEPVKESDTCTS